MELLFFNQKHSLPQKSIITIGMFDGVHLGHQVIIRELLANADKHSVLPVLITFSQHPRFFLKQEDSSLRLLSTPEERYALMERFGITHCIEIPFNKEIASLSAIRFIEKFLIQKLDFSGLILGYDNHFGNKQENDFEEIFSLSKEKGFFIQKTDPLFCEGTPISSTQIRKAIQSNDMVLANKMLGYTYSFSGLVVHGRKIGTTLGFPTANIGHINPLKIMPPDGVYAVNVRIENSTALHKGMMNIGINPTFPDRSRSIEAHLLSFEGNLYDKKLTIEVVKKIREEQKFEKIDQLIRQLEMDKVQSLSIL